MFRLDIITFGVGYWLINPSLQAELTCVANPSSEAEPKTSSQSAYQEIPPTEPLSNRFEMIHDTYGMYNPSNIRR